MSVFFIRQSLGPISLILHTAYIIYTLTVIGMFTDSHPMAPVLEFFRCAVFVLYSRGKLVLVTKAMIWLELSSTWDAAIQMFLRNYFFFAMIFWGLVCTRKLWQRALTAKIKLT